MFLTQTEAEASLTALQPQEHTGLCAPQGITHNPAVSQTNAYITAEKLKQTPVHF